MDGGMTAKTWRDICGDLEDDLPGDTTPDAYRDTTHKGNEPPATSPTGAVPYTAAELVTVLGITAKDLAKMTHRSERSVRRWIAGTCPPKGLARHRMTLLARIAYYLEAAIGDLPPDEWLRSPNAGLNGRIPLDMLVADKSYTVAEFLSTGVQAIRDPYTSRRRTGFRGSGSRR